jgi:hypothetical protein
VFVGRDLSYVTATVAAADAATFSYPGKIESSKTLSKIVNTLNQTSSNNIVKILQKT